MTTAPTLFVSRVACLHVDFVYAFSFSPLYFYALPLSYNTIHIRVYLYTTYTDIQFRSLLRFCYASRHTLTLFFSPFFILLLLRQNVLALSSSRVTLQSTCGPGSFSRFVSLSLSSKIQI